MHQDKDAAQGKPSYRRRNYIVDKKYQLGLVARLCLGLTGIIFFYVGFLFVAPTSDEFDVMSGEEMRSLVLKLSIAFYVVCLVGIACVTIVLTHRVAGPVMVLKQAIVGMREGDYSRRLELRKEDYLHDLAEELFELRETLKEREAALEERTPVNT